MLLEDLETGTVTLLEKPSRTVTAFSAIQVNRALSLIDALLEEGNSVGGWIGYEAGYALEPRLHRLLKWQNAYDPLLCLFSFRSRTIMPTAEVDSWLLRQGTGTATLEDIRPAITFEQYAQSFHCVKESILAGDIYQANLTFPLWGRWKGDPITLYRTIRPEAEARFAVLMYDGFDWILSFSPELFFSADNKLIKAKPMKGTRPRGHDRESDARFAAELAESAKDRAENLMIVDLMRNDLSRLSVPGSVKVNSPFNIEAYPTVFQMTTSITATLAKRPSLSSILPAMFPCGSITGAPKLRAMEIINAVEHWPRGHYCGSIGEILGGRRSDGVENVSWQCRFNVAIRSLRLRPGAGEVEGRAYFGVGSGIVADSVLEDEWEECLLKAKFVHRAIGAPD